MDRSYGKQGMPQNYIVIKNITMGRSVVWETLDSPTPTTR